MQKDVIYIDVEDDITAIIGKVKAAQHKIVALVPPKRIGAIQSAVNLKLVHRAAETADKRLVIISNNAALIALAGSAGIPVSKNLQSKPELAEIPALELDEGDDVIDGAELPIGDHVDMAGGAVDDTIAPAVGAAAVSATGTPKLRTAAGARGAAAPALRSKVKVPDFDIFRKRLFIAIAAGILLVGGLVWALVFAPQARVIITARTTDAALASKVTTGDSLTTDLKAGTIKSLTKTVKKEASVPFTATGSKDVGEKATGSVRFSNDSFDPVVVSGTVSAGGFNFTLTSPVTVPKGTCSRPSSCSAGTATGTIVAVEGGTRYNGVTGAVTGVGSDVSASLVSATTGGTDKTVVVVTQADVDKVSGDVSKAGVSEAAKNELLTQFGVGYIILDASFKADSSGVKPTPAVDAEAPDGKGALAGSVTYTLVGLPKAEVGKYLDSYFAQQIDGKTDQKTYSNGLSTVSFTNISAIEGGGMSANITTNGKIGPKIDEVALKEYAKGKRYGEIQSYVNEINGVDSVDIKFSPFWVSGAPNDTKKITVEFKVNGS